MAADEGRLELDDTLNALGEVPKRLGLHATAYDQDARPRDGSRYADDAQANQGDAARQELLGVGVWRARNALRLSEDVALALSRALKPPPSVFASHAMTRSSIEAAGAVLWLMDDGVDAETRIRRVVAIRRRDLRGQVGFSRAGSSEPLGEEAKEIQRAAVDWAERELSTFEAKVSGLRLKALSAPNFERLAAGRLEESYNWEIFSSVAHGNPHAMDAIWKMFHNSNPEVAGSAFMNLVTTAVQAHSMAVWAFVNYLHGGDPEALRGSLERLYDDVHMSEETRAFFRL